MTLKMQFKHELVGVINFICEKRDKRTAGATVRTVMEMLHLRCTNDVYILSIHLILNPIVEVDNIAVDTWKTNLVAFDTPRYNANQRCSAINVANEWTTRITLTCIFSRRGNWFTALIQRRFICMRNTSTYLILIYPKTIIRKFTFTALSSARASTRRQNCCFKRNKTFLWLRQYVRDIKLTPADCNFDGVLPFH